MNKQYPTFTNKGTYFLLTIPLIILFIAVAYYLWNYANLFFWIYLGMMIMMNLFQSYCCAFQQCHYMHGFCPGIGGIIVPASRVARIYGKKANSKVMFKVSAIIASLFALGIIILPLFFLKDLGILLVLLYCLIFIAYGQLFLSMLCPACATKQTCPAGIMSA